MHYVRYSIVCLLAVTVTGLTQPSREAKRKRNLDDNDSWSLHRNRLSHLEDKERFSQAWPTFSAHKNSWCGLRGEVSQVLGDDDYRFQQIYNTVQECQNTFCRHFSEDRWSDSDEFLVFDEDSGVCTLLKHIKKFTINPNGTAVLYDDSCFECTRPSCPKTHGTTLIENGDFEKSHFLGPWNFRSDGWRPTKCIISPGKSSAHALELSDSNGVYSVSQRMSHLNCPDQLFRIEFDYKFNATSDYEVIHYDGYDWDGYDFDDDYYDDYYMQSSSSSAIHKHNFHGSYDPSYSGSSYYGSSHYDHEFELQNEFEASFGLDSRFVDRESNGIVVPWRHVEAYDWDMDGVEFHRWIGGKAHVDNVQITLVPDTFTTVGPSLLGNVNDIKIDETEGWDIYVEDEHVPGTSSYEVVSPGFEGNNYRLEWNGDNGSHKGNLWGMDPELVLTHSVPTKAGRTYLLSFTYELLSAKKARQQRDDVRINVSWGICTLDKRGQQSCNPAVTYRASPRWHMHRHDDMKMGPRTWQMPMYATHDDTDVRIKMSVDYPMDGKWKLAIGNLSVKELAGSHFGGDKSADETTRLEVQPQKGADL